MLVALPAFLYSLLASTRRGCVVVHVLVPEHQHPTSALQEVEQRARRACLKVRMHAIDGSAHLLLRQASSSADTMELVRFYLPAILKLKVVKVLWVDVDVLVRCDAHTLLSQAFAGGDAGAHIAAAARATPVTIGMATAGRLSLVLNRIGWLSAAQRRVRRPMFNGGILAINLREWRRGNVTRAVERLVLGLRRAGQSRYKAMTGGLPDDSSQLPLAILFSDIQQRLAKLPAVWNVDGLGWRAAVSNATLSAACAWHWSGDRKGWHLTEGLHTHLWAPANRSAAEHGLTRVLGPLSG